MKKRVYVIEYEIITNMYSLGGPKTEARVEYYSRTERDTFIKRYYALKDKYYIESIKTYFSELEEINVDDIVNAI